MDSQVSLTKLSHKIWKTLYSVSDLNLLCNIHTHEDTYKNKQASKQKKKTNKNNTYLIISLIPSETHSLTSIKTGYIVVCFIWEYNMGIFDKQVFVIMI